MLRVGLVGAGAIGRRRARVAAAFPTTEMALVADVDAAAAEAAAAEVGCECTTNWEDVTRHGDIQIAVISTPNKFHAPMAVAAMSEGKHVLCEKPLARNTEEARQMVEAARTYQRKLKTGFNHRHLWNIQKAKELVDQGALGDLMFIRCRYGHGGRPGYDKEWRTEAELGGGGELLDQGVHALDLFRWFLGDMTQAVGFTSTFFWNVAPLEDNAFALFRNNRGQVASLHVSWTQWKNLFSFQVFGRDGYVLAEGRGGNYGRERVTLGRRQPESGPPIVETFEFPEHDRSWEAEWQEFITAIQEDREPLANGYDGWQAIEMVYAVYQSVQEGRVVRL